MQQFLIKKAKFSNHSIYNKCVVSIRKYQYVINPTKSATDSFN